jgi:hypothetical protein
MSSKLLELFVIATNEIQVLRCINQIYIQECIIDLVIDEKILKFPPKQFSTFNDSTGAAGLFFSLFTVTLK